MSTSTGPPERIDQPDNQDVIETGKEAFARGYTPVRDLEGDKKPALKGWQNTRYSSQSEVEEAFAPGRDGAPNIGLLLGDASQGLTDIDLDDPIARKVASSFLPRTAMQWGRKSCPPSHRGYMPDESIGFHQFKDAVGRVLLEIRGDNKRQTLIPPSVYPEKTEQDIGAVLPSEACIWFGEPFGGAQGPAKVSRVELVVAAAATALVALLAPAWPSVTGREAAYLALAGGLLRDDDAPGRTSGLWSPDLVADVMHCLAELTGDDGFDRERCWEIVMSTVDTLSAGGNPTGRSKLGGLFGEDVVNAAMNIADDAYGLAGMAAPSRLRPSSATPLSGVTEEGPGEGAAASTDDADACRAYAERSHNPRACVRCRLAERRAATEAERLFEVAEHEAFARAVNGDLSADEEAALLGRFTPLAPADVRSKTPEPDIVEGLIAYSGSVNQIDGYRGSQKTFVAISLAGAVGGGLPKLFGVLDVNVHGPVLYLYLEGPGGLPRRLAAWEHYYKRQMNGVTFLHDPVDIKRPEDVEALAVLTRRLGAVLVIIDSVAKTGGGREDVEDFSRYRLGLETLRDASGAAIVVLHNTGHDTTRGRGHTTLIDGMDSAVLLQKKSDKDGGGVALVDEKSRDTAGIEDLRLTFHPCGEINPKTGTPWSGVPVVQDPDITLGTMLVGHAEIVAKVRAAIDGAAEPGAATPAEMASALGCPRNNLARQIHPLFDNGFVATNGKSTTALRYVRGQAAA